MGYFSNFPNTVYSNNVCIDLLKRVRIMDKVRSDPFSYYPYTVKDGQRADWIADNYYHDQMRSWLVWLSMDIIDPYYQYPLTEEQFNNFITAKYGSSDNAQNMTAYWELNWSDDDGELSLTGYSQLPDALKKYYTPIYGIGANIISYVRRKEDWLTTTNMIVTFTVDSNTPYEAGELAKIKIGNTVYGNVVVAWSNSSTVMAQHVQGNTTVTNAVLVGLTSNVTSNITTQAFTSNCIPIDERVYWEPVSFWDHERSRNELRKHIKLIDSKYTGQAEKELKQEMNS